MKGYIYKVCLCDGHYCNGSIAVEAETEEEAYNNAMDYVLTRLASSLPELGIDVSIELEDECCYYEAVEVCPHCMSENVYPMWDTEVSGFVAVCKHCGKEIFLCDECLHTILEDGEVHDCDWCQTKCGGKCHRGETRD